MILADTSVWVDHLREGDAEVARRLEQGLIATHPLIAAEIALGSLKRRGEVLSLLDGLPCAPVATIQEVRVLIETHPLHQRGIGYVDAALVAACRLAPDTRLWTRDRRLREVAREAGIAADT